MPKQEKLLIFDTHPIQYRSPVFRALYRKDPNLHVYFFNPDFDGAKKWFHEVGKAKAEAWGVDLLSGYPYTQLHTGTLGWRALYHELKRVLISEQPKAVLIYGYYLKEHWVLRFLCHALHIRILFVGETFDTKARGPRKWIREILLSYFFAGIQAFIAIGEKTHRYYQGRKIATSRIFQARYCIDTDFFITDSESIARRRNAVRKRTEIPEDAFVILFAGRLFERKRPHDAIALQQALVGEHSVHTVIVGKGPLEETLRNKYGQPQGLHWAGFQTQQEIRDWYCAADLLFVPSEFETWGLVVNEAFACQLPALVTETCGSADDLVIPEETGFVFKVGDIDTAKRYALQLISDSGLRKEMGMRAQQKLIREYRPEQFAEMILNASIASG